MSVVVEIPRRSLARITGGFYVAFVLALALADSLGHIGVGDVDLAYDVLATDPTQFAVGLTFGMLSAFLFVMAAWGLYVLLRPVNPELALSFIAEVGLGLWLLLKGIGGEQDAPGPVDERRAAATAS